MIPSPQFSLFTSNRRTWLGFALVFAALAANGLISITNVLQAIHDKDKAAKIRQVLDQIHQVSLLVANGTASARLFAITGKPEDLNPYNFAAQNAPGEIAALQILTRGDVYQQERLQQLDPLINKSLHFSKTLLELRQKKGFAPVARIISKGEGIALVDRIQALLILMESGENSLLKPRMEESARSLQRAFVTFLVTSLAVMALLFTVIFLTVRDFLRQENTDRVLRESGERLRLFDGLTEEAIMIHDQGVILEVNQALTQLLGYGRPEIIGKHISNFMAEDSIGDTQSRLEKGYPEGSYEITAKRKDGSTFPLLVHGRDFMFRGRQMRASSGWDISERKRAEQALKESEERFRKFAGVTVEGIMIHEAGIISDVNQALLTMLRCESPDFLGTDGLDFLTGESAAKVRGFRKEGYPPGPYELAVRRKDGTQFPAEFHGRAFDYGGKKLRVVSVWDITGRKKAEEALRRSEENFRALIEGAPDAILVNRDGKIVYANKRCLAFLGYGEAGQLLRRDPLEIVHQDDREMVVKRIERALEGGENPSLEVRMIRGDGTLIDAESTSVGIQFEGRTSTMVILRDITDRKKAEEVLRHSEAKFRSLIENSYDLITVLDRKGQRLYESPSLERILGYKPGERKGLTFDTQPPEEQERARRVFEEAVANPGVPFKTRLKALRKDGRTIDADMVITNLLDDPAVGGIVVNGRDITEQKKAEEALRISEEKFRSLIENSNDVISITGRDGLMNYISPSVKRILGYDPGERIGQGYAHIMHPDDLGRIKGEFTKLLGTKGASWTVEFRLRHKDGSWRHVESTGMNLLENPSVQGIVYNLRDITEQKKAEGALQQKERYFRALIEKSYDALVLIDKDGLVRYASPGMKNIYGYGGEERLGRGSLELVHPAERARIQELFTGLLGNPGMSETVQARFRHKDGHYVTVDVRATNLLEDPDVGGVVVNYRDVSEKKRAEEALREREEYYRALTENTADLIAVLDVNGKVIYIGPAVKKMMGFTQEEREGRDAFDTVHPDDLERARGLFQKLTQSPPGTAIPFIMRLQHKDGRWRNVEGAGQNLLGHPSVRGIVVNMRDVTERVEAQEALTQSEENFRNLIENSNDVISVVGTDWKAHYVSSSIRKVMGYDPEERVGNSFMELVHPEDKAMATELFREFVYKPGVTVTAEVRALHKNGTWRHLDVVATNLLNHPAIQGIIFNYRDVTEKKLAERALVESEESFRDLIEKSPDAMIVHKPRQIVYVNGALLKLLGYEGHQQLIGKNPEVIIHPDDREAVNERVRRLKPGEGYNPPAERRFLTREGRSVPVEVVSFSVPFQGEPMVVAVARDLTERKLAEENFKNLIEKSPDAMLIHRMDKILYANPAFLKLTGYEKPEELTGQSPEVIVPPEEREKVAERYKKLEQANDVNPPAERMIFRKDGGRLAVEVVSFSILFQGGMAAVVVMRDLTERKETEQALMRFERLSTIGEMAAGIAHEIRNPLAAISAAAQILKRKKTKKETSDSRYLDTIVEQTHRLDRLVLDTLQYARAEKPLQQDSFSLQEALESAMRLCQIQFGPSHGRVKVEWDLPKKELKLTANAQRVQQILINLILNAYQVMPEGGALRISLKSDKNSAFIRVEDTGPGIKDGDLKRIFEPFFTTKGGGSGLGLALSQRIAKEHGGEITLERLTPHGTAFTLRVPLGGGKKA